MAVVLPVKELYGKSHINEMDYSYQKDENLFDELSNVFDEFIPGDEILDSKMNFDSSLFDSLMDISDSKTQWPDVFPQLLDFQSTTNNGDGNLKSELETPSGSPRSLSSSDSCSSSDIKFSIETPPISPPRLDSSPQNVGIQPVPIAPQVGKKSTILKINPNNIKIIPCAANMKGLRPVGKQTQIVLPKEILEKVEKIKKETEVTSHLDIKVSSPQNQHLVYTSPVQLSQGNVKKIAPNIPVLTNNAQVLTVDGVQPLTVLQSTATVTLQDKPEVNNRRDEFAMKYIKKQQRMIKNRESACLSRKKKKEYVTSLEAKLKDLEQDNWRLKVENDFLKDRIKKLESSCYEKPTKAQNVFNNFRKTTAVLAVLFMVSLNIGSLSLLQKDGIANELKLNEGPVSNGRSRHFGRTLLWADSGEQTPANKTSLKPSMCPLHINQTESLRLEKELRRWIAVDGEQVRSRNSSRLNSFLKPSLRQFFLHSPPFKPWKNHRTRQRRLDSAIEVYRASAPFPGSLPRRDDTFYVVSFSSDHLLLPALAHNVTLRPKMSLVLPTISLNDSLALNGTIPMMQIDCEVLATRSLQFTGKDINTLRQKRQDSKGNGTEQVAVKDVHYRPYFLKASKPSPGLEFDQNFDNYINRAAP